MASHREQIVLATKYTLSMNPTDPNASGNHRKNLIQSVEASLNRLKTDAIDLLWVHAWDPFTPVEEVMRALDDLVRSGKVFYVGISDAPAWIVSQANTLAELRGWSAFVGLQIRYNLVDRTAERDLLPMAKAFDIGVTAWSPQAGGLLSGKYGQKNADPRRYGPGDPFGKTVLTDRNMSVAESVAKIAAQTGRTSSQLSLRWLLEKCDMGVIIPIIGARTLAQLKDNLGCLDFEIQPAHMQQLESVSRIDLGFPHDFLDIDMIKSTIYGETLDLIDNHRK